MNPQRKLRLELMAKNLFTLELRITMMLPYTKEPERKQRYIDRHSKNEDRRNPLPAALYSRWILWNKPTITESIRDTNRRFKNINIINIK